MAGTTRPRNRPARAGRWRGRRWRRWRRSPRWSWVVPFDGGGEFAADALADLGEAGDVAVQVGEFALEDGDRAGAHGARLVAGAEAFDERSCVLEVEADVQQGADLPHQPQVHLVEVA